MAEKCNISEVYFRKIFTETYKITLKQFIVDIRINKAKQLLSEGFLKIGAIADLCDFSNQYNFCRLFKEKTGFTPTEYMKRNRIYKIWRQQIRSSFSKTVYFLLNSITKSLSIFSEVHNLVEGIIFYALLKFRPWNYLIKSVD